MGRGAADDDGIVVDGWGEGGEEEAEDVLDGLHGCLCEQV